MKSIGGIRHKFPRQILLTIILLVTCFLVAAQATDFYASRKSNKYHYASCRWAQKIKPGNLIIFSSPGEAAKAGYVPCKVCRPPAAK